MSDVEIHSSSEHDAGAISDQTHSVRNTRASKSTHVVLADDVVSSMKKDIKKLFDASKASKNEMKAVSSMAKRAYDATMSMTEQLNAIAKKLNVTHDTLISSSSSSSSHQQHEQQQQQHQRSNSVSTININDVGSDRSADDSQYIHNTPPSSYSNNNTLNDTSYSNTSDMFRPSSMRKRPRRYSSESDTSYGYTSNESNDDRKHKKKSLNIHYARIRVIRKLKGSDVNIFNPALHEHSASSEAPAIKSVQTLRNCISLMMQLVVKYHKNDAEALEGAVKYLGQFDSICTEYNNDACVADLLDLDMHCRHKSGRWRYSDNDKIVRRIMRKLQNKMISNMPIERERTSTYNSYNNNNNNQKTSSRYQRHGIPHGKSYTPTSRPRVSACYKYNGRDKNNAWTSTSHCDKSDDTCTFSHVCSQCFGGHPRYSKDGCKHAEHDMKHASK